MGRRKSSTAEDLIDVVAMMPWYAGVVFAVVAFVCWMDVRCKGYSPRARGSVPITQPTAFASPPVTHLE